MACCDEILKNVGENLERRLPDPEEVAEGLVHKLIGSEKETGDEKVNNLILLTHYTLTSACIFSILLSIHFQRS